MSNQLSALLSAWKNNPQQDWVLATVYKTEGASYRKAGAMMLIDQLGSYYGMLSGGCLESDILRNARKVMHSGKPLLLTYDGSDEDDWSFKLGIGCGGRVHIMLQPVTAENDLRLAELYASLVTRRRGGHYRQKIAATEAYFEECADLRPMRSYIETREDGEWLVSTLTPQPHLLVIGGGVDARPVVAMAAQLGWRVSVADPRPANARAEYFQSVSVILRSLGETLAQFVKRERVNAVVIMSHNLDMDAEALLNLQDAKLDYLGMLGPLHRFKKVLKLAGLQQSQLSCPVSAPVGLDIGGQLPESIALSILAECHAVLHQSSELPELGIVSVS